MAPSALSHLLLLPLLTLLALSDAALILSESSFTSPDGVLQCRWEVSPDHQEVHFVVRSFYDGWVGIGFSDSGLMDKTDYIMAWVDEASSAASVTDRYTHPSNSRWTPKLDADLGGQDDLYNVSGARAMVNGQMVSTFYFSRKCHTEDPNDVAFEDRDIYMLFAYGPMNSGSPSAHSTTGRGAVLINLFSGASRSDPRRHFVMIHGIFMVVAWTLLILPMAILARYFKLSVGSWFRIHWMVIVFALACVLASFILILIKEAGFIVTVHSVVGAVVVGLSICQAILGKVADLLWYEGKPPSFADKAHWFLGYFVLLFAIVSNFLGFLRLGVPNLVLYLYASSIVLTLVFILCLEKFVGQAGEHEVTINDGGESETQALLGKKRSRRPLALFGLYWVISSLLVAAALYYAFDPFF